VSMDQVTQVARFLPTYGGSGLPAEAQENIWIHQSGAIITSLHYELNFVLLSHLVILYLQSSCSHWSGTCEGSF